LVKAVVASLPAELVELLLYRSLPKRLRWQFLAGTGGGRTQAQILGRAARRWAQRGCVDALHSAEGKGIGSAVGVAMAPVQAGECLGRAGRGLHDADGGHRWSAQNVAAARPVFTGGGAQMLLSALARRPDRSDPSSALLALPATLGNEELRVVAAGVPAALGRPFNSIRQGAAGCGSGRRPPP
jgi:hypothetical protein